ncbi:MAG: LacI family transcriptional regulator [Propionibacteriaceae bacterium]|jgi:DNA-binding LacI/PurR family transcriptional regulator|nr:LacI family transcriptional regulator [Propionibacteriaceae bacterium]
MASGERRPTVRDVAAAAGVSRGTVSRVLNGGRWVSPEARAAVDRAIAETGYRVNPLARGLATGRTGSVAFLLTEPQQLLFEDPNFATLLIGTTQALAAQDLALVLLVAGSLAERDRAVAFMTGGHVDGVILVSPHKDNLLPRQLSRAGVPVVVAGSPRDYDAHASFVGADNVAGGRTATRCLLDRGCRRIATITGPLDTSGGPERLAGYRAALGENYDERLVVHGDWSPESGRAGMAELLAREPDLDGLFAGNDAMASGALATLAAAGRRVPDDVAVVGFDDNRYALATTPALTTLHQPYDAITAEMVRLIIGQIRGEPPRTVHLDVTLVRRQSA